VDIAITKDNVITIYPFDTSWLLEMFQAAYNLYSNPTEGNKVAASLFQKYKNSLANFTG